MKLKGLTQQIVHELIRYDKETGKLYWKPREPYWFETYASWRRFNSGHAGMELNPGYLQAKVLGFTQQKARLVWIMHTGSVPNGDKYKILTVNRDVHDTRIENLICVPSTISVRQKHDECSVASATGRYGVYWRSDECVYVGEFVEISGKKTSKRFDNFEDAEWFRYSNEPMHNYKDISEYTTGNNLTMDFLEGSEHELIEHIEEHTFKEIVVSDDTRRMMSVSASKNKGSKGNNYKGKVIGTHMISGDTIEFEGAIQMREAGFLSSNIYRAIREPYRTHKGYRWVQEKDK